MIDTLMGSIVSEELEYSGFQTESSTPSADLVRWPAPWRDSKIQEIQNLSQLPPNWDSYRAHPADPRSIYWAVTRIRAIALETSEEPRIACLPSGNVVLIWDADDDSQTCEFEFLPNGLIEFMSADDHDPSADREGIVSNLGYILPLIPGTGT